MAMVVGLAFAEVAVTEFRLIDGDTHESVRVINDGDVLTLYPNGDVPRRANFQAIVSETNEDDIAVFFSIANTDTDYMERRRESGAPYAMYGDDGKGKFYSRYLTAGNYVLTATPEYGDDLYGEALSISFTLVARPVKVTGYTLVDAENQVDIKAINDGDVFSMDDMPTSKLSVRVDTEGYIRYVSMNLNDGVRLRQEYYQPFSPFGRSSTGVREGLMPGYWQLEATPFDHDDAAGESSSVAFSITPASGASVQVDHCLGLKSLKNCDPPPVTSTRTH